MILEMEKHTLPNRNYLDAYENLNEVVKKLMAPDGCPWDREQTHESLKNYLIEEAYEFVEAVEENNPEMMEEELGDLLFHVVIHAVIAEKNNTFNLETVAKKITEKMIRRHPHVFGDAKVDSVDDVWKTWDKIKSKEKKIEKKDALLNAVPKTLPALLRAEKLQKRAARVGFDWAALKDVFEKLDEEYDELKQALALNSRKEIMHELGDLLFTVVNICRRLDIDPEDALQQTNKRFINRFTYLENRLIQQNKGFENTTLNEMDALWDEAKATERSE